MIPKQSTGEGRRDPRVTEPELVSADAISEPERFARAPIVEAALVVNATMKNQVDQEKLASFQERLESRYPGKQVRMSWSGQWQFRPDTPPVAKTATEGAVGYLFTSPDGKQIVQARKDGFAFSRLQPYQDWKTFRREAADLWTRYVAHIQPHKIERIALRYINRIELPLPLHDLKDYVLTGPELAPGIPQKLSTFFFRAIVPLEQDGAFASITETIAEDDTSKGVLPLILDIDVFRMGAFPLQVEKLFPYFDGLRNLKNLLFFNTLTDKTKALFR